jgi:hypothetical protein
MVTYDFVFVTVHENSLRCSYTVHDSCYHLMIYPKLFVGPKLWIDNVLIPMFAFIYISGSTVFYYAKEYEFQSVSMASASKNGLQIS